MIIFFLFTLIIGFLLTKLFLPEYNNKWVVLSYSIALGIMIDSVMTFVLEALNIASQISVFISEILIAILLFIIYKKKKIKLYIKEKTEYIPKKLRIFLLFIIFSVFLKICTEFINTPWGSWDSLFLWGFHTKFLFILNQMGIHWSYLFNPAINWTHLDYPLLLPLYNLNKHILIGEYNFFVSFITSLLIYLGILFGLYGSLKELTNNFNAIIAVIIFMISEEIIDNMTMQYADLPLGFFILLSFVSLFLFQKNNKKTFLILSYIFASTAAYCKNEGIVFFILFVILSLIFTKNKDIKLTILYCIFSPPFLCLLFQKFFLAGQCDLFANQNWNVVTGKILDFSRAKLILSYFCINIFYLFKIYLIIFLFSILTGFRKLNKYKNLNIMILVCFFVIWTVYFAIYMITPHDLLFHLRTSLKRLIIQYVPLFIFFIFIFFNCCDKKQISKQ